MFTKIHDITFPIQDFVNCEVSIHIPTQQGKAIAYNLDWVIKDSLGNLTVESSGTFERNYSKVYYKP